jgi:hypothetical protein
MLRLDPFIGSLRRKIKYYSAYSAGLKYVIFIMERVKSSKRRG